MRKLVNLIEGMVRVIEEGYLEAAARVRTDTGLSRTPVLSEEAATEGAYTLEGKLTWRAL